MFRRLFGAIVMVLLATAAGLPLSGLAYADENPEEVVDGECSATLLGDRGKPLLVDADAVLVDGVLPAVRLGTSTDRIAEEPAVDVPVGDVVELLDVRDVPVAGQVAEAGCGTVDTAGDGVDQVAATTSALAEPVQAAVSPPEPEEPAEPVAPVAPQPPLDEVPADGGEVVEALPEQPVGALQASPLTATPALASLPLGPLPKIEVPVPDAAAPSTGILHGGRTDDLSATNTGQVEALPQSAAPEPARAPFVLAVGLLAVVLGVLVRRWITRSAA